MWIPEKTTIAYKTAIMDLVRNDCYYKGEPDRKHEFYVLKTRDWSNVIPVTEQGKIVMIKQYRIGIDDFTLEIPGGVIETGEDIGKAALREMTEETGYELTSGGTCKKLGYVHPNPAIQNNLCHLFIAGPVKKTRPQNLDPGEVIETLEVDIQDIPEMILSGRVSHALILNNFMCAILQKEEGKQGLIKGLEEFRAPDAVES